MFLDKEAFLEDVHLWLFFSFYPIYFALFSVLHVSGFVIVREKMECLVVEVCSLIHFLVNANIIGRVAVEDCFGVEEEDLTERDRTHLGAH